LVVNHEELEWVDAVVAITQADFILRDVTNHVNATLVVETLRLRNSHLSIAIRRLVIVNILVAVPAVFALHDNHVRCRIEDALDFLTVATEVEATVVYSVVNELKR